MKDAFNGYYRPTNEEFGQLWGTCIFVLDANVLLNLYRYSDETRESFMDILRHLAETNRLWLPHQAGLEYHRNRISVITKQASEYNTVTRQLKDLKTSLESSLHPFTDDRLLVSFQRLAKRMERDLAERGQTLTTLPNDDPVRDAVTEIYRGRVGSPYRPEKLVEIEKAGKTRYERRVPPGYRDDSKEGASKYGDLILWHQILDHASLTKSPIVFVTNDEKEDWWLRQSDQTFGPRPELIDEIRITADVNFYMYKADQFMKHAEQHLQFDVPEAAVQEVQTIQQEDEYARRVCAAGLADSSLLDVVKLQREMPGWAALRAQLALAKQMPESSALRHLQEDILGEHMRLHDSGWLKQIQADTQRLHDSGWLKQVQEAQCDWARFLISEARVNLQRLQHNGGLGMATVDGKGLEASDPGKAPDDEGASFHDYEGEADDGAEEDDGSVEPAPVPA